MSGELLLLARAATNDQTATTAAVMEYAGIIAYAISGALVYRSADLFSLTC